jgi:putative flippase GtrA
VGAGGMVVQLVTLAILDRWMAGHYLLATAMAIEITLLHNFAWHLRYTWRDRRAETGVMCQLMRFHLSNGLVSMAGNLAYMPLLVEEAKMPLLIANGVAIVGCSVMNFALGDRWVFKKEQRSAIGVQRSEKTARGPESNLEITLREPFDSPV